MISRRRIPITICPSWKFVQGLVQAFDDNEDETLTAEEKLTLITTLATNPEIALNKFILNQKVSIPILPYFGACGRLTFIQGPYKPLSSFIKEPLALRVNLGAQILQLIDDFIHNDINWLLFTRDLNYDNFIVSEGNQVFLKDMSHVLIIDKEAFDLEDVNDTQIQNWSDAKFDEYYEDLVGIKNDQNYVETCSKLPDYSLHMFSLACQFVLSDLEHDLESRRSNPLAKSYPGLLHHLDEDSQGLFQDVKIIESLIEKCSSAPDLDTRHDAANQLMQELLFEKDEDEDEDDDDGGEDDEKEDFDA